MSEDPVTALEWVEWWRAQDRFDFAEVKEFIQTTDDVGNGEGMRGVELACGGIIVIPIDAADQTSYQL